MIKILEEAVEKIRKLPADRQAMAAEILEQIASDTDGASTVPEADRRAVLEGLEQALRDEFAADAAVNDVLEKPWR